MSAPNPPTDLASRAPLTVTIPTTAELQRFYTAAHTPIFFDRSDKGRLNSPDGAYGVLYTAKRPNGAFAETFLRNPGMTLIGRDQIMRKAYTRLRLRRPLKLVRFFGKGLARIGATAEITHGGLPYGLPQRWSAALFTHPIKPDGIAYRARYDDDELCYAIFDRAANYVEELARFLDLDQGWFYELAEYYKVGLAP